MRTVALAEGRELVIVSPEEARLLSVSWARPVSAVLSSQVLRPADADGVIAHLLDIGCKFFMFSGASATALEDKCDEIIEARLKNDLDFPTTTAHEDEPEDDIVALLVEVGGRARGTLLVAVVNEEEPLAQALRSLCSSGS